MEHAVLLKAFFFGIIMAMSIGPIAILILNNSIKHGFRLGFYCGLGAALADLTYALITFSFDSLLLKIFSNNNFILTLFSSTIMSITGVYLIYKSFNIKVDFDSQMAVKEKKMIAFSKVYFLTIANPLTMVVFFGFTGKMKILGINDIILASFFVCLGSLIIQSNLAFFGASLRRFISNNKNVKMLNFLSGFFIFCYGISEIFKF